ncbi:MAG: DNA-3-methyladenine glycosylase 2 family protein [Ruminococcaceae bacterium]|nr:DNA-3-methyladenine glycosylase 2 family protein [Oscillospiraceae bacterium]
MIIPTVIDAGRDYVTVGGCGNFSVYKTFDCGQAFRFDPVDGDTSKFSGIAHGKRVIFEQTGEGQIKIHGANEEDYCDLWAHYLALDEDYDLADSTILGAMPNDADRLVMSEAVRCGAGIRILRQDPFEALISFIISQNNNIPRIKKIITALCDKYGVDGAFPTAEALYNAGEEGLFALKTGFRAGYIHDAAKKILSGEVSLSEIDNCDDYDRATEMLCKIKGVGPKVSSCVLLFGFGKTEAFPIDVWIRRSLEKHFPNGFDPSPMGKYAGIAQQYLFYYERWLGGGE